jgi:hypothetical protein
VILKDGVPELSYIQLGATSKLVLGSLVNNVESIAGLHGAIDLRIPDRPLRLAASQFHRSLDLSAYRSAPSSRTCE